MEFALSVVVPPIQIAPVLVAPVDEGLGFTVAVVTAVALQPIWSVTVNVSVPEAVLLTDVIDGFCSVLL